MPVQFAIGQREFDKRTVAVRRLGSKKQETVALEEAIDSLLAEIEKRA